MKINYLDNGSHWTASIELILETLQQQGHELVKHNKFITNPDGVILRTSNASRPEYNLNNYTFFYPHGLGVECWSPKMAYDRVLLAGPKPWIPPEDFTNYTTVGWAKTDEIINPNPEKQETVKASIETLPYSTTMLLIPYPEGCGIQDSLPIVKTTKSKEINLIIAFRECKNEARKYYQHEPSVHIPDIMNLYYFIPHITGLIADARTSIIREFYFTGLPSILLRNRFEETKTMIPSTEIEDKLPIHLERMQKDKDSYTYLEEAENFITKIDGKCTERIINEMLKITGEK